MSHAICWRSGEIDIVEFDDKKGAINLATGNSSDLIGAISATARKSRTNETWFVPGVPEAGGDGDALEAAMAYGCRLRRALAELEQRP